MRKYSGIALLVCVILASFECTRPLQAAQQSGNVEDRLPTSADPDSAASDQAAFFPDRPELRDGVITAAPLSPDAEGEPANTPPPLRDGPASLFVLAAVDISGASVFAPETFAPLYDALLARAITLNDVVALTDAITAKYRDEGYFLSRAVAPAQTASTGVLHIDIVEGYIAKLDIKGDAPKAIRRRLEDLIEERPLRLSSFERTMTLINDMRGVSVVSSELQPDIDDMEAHTLVVELDVDRFEASLYADNRGVESAGPVQTYTRVAANSILKTGDQLSAGVFFIPDDPGELLLGELNYHTPIGRDGTYATLSGMYAKVDAGASLAAFDVESETKQAAFNVTHPLIRKRKTSLWASIGFQGRDIEEIQLGAPQFNDKLRIGYVSANFRKDHLNGATSFFGSVSRGFNMLGASMGGAPLSRPDADGEFTRFNTEISRYQNIGKTFGLYASFAGQASLDPLLASEEFALGGARYGRAYDYGELTGDDGVATLVELRYGRDPGLGVLDFYQVYGFFDYGVVWNDNAAPGFDSLSLSSAGAGLRLTFPASLNANFEIARPLDRTPFTQNDRDWRGFFSVSKNF
ncbi:MAG: ShlB/FhaC/HecB family hemolysin secretion/activation protein [Pseudomonadota bacterium]